MSSRHDIRVDVCKETVRVVARHRTELSIEPNVQSRETERSLWTGMKSLKVNGSQRTQEIDDVFLQRVNEGTSLKYAKESRATLHIKG